MFIGIVLFVRTVSAATLGEGGEGGIRTHGSLS